MGVYVFLLDIAKAPSIEVGPMYNTTHIEVSISLHPCKIYITPQLASIEFCLCHFAPTSPRLTPTQQMYLGLSSKSPVSFLIFSSFEDILCNIKGVAFKIRAF